MTEGKGELLYLDSSALVKLVLPEAESAALLESLAAWPERVSSELARVEVMRAARRASAGPIAERRAEEILAGLHLLKIDSDILGRASRLGPPALRSLDAIHLASALSLGVTEKAEVSVGERLRRAYDLLAEDSSGADIESAFAIQAEALLGE
jgi:predicted nucleic acid-binding protein